MIQLQSVACIRKISFHVRFYISFVLIVEIRWKLNDNKSKEKKNDKQAVSLVRDFQSEETDLDELFVQDHPNS